MNKKMRGVADPFSLGLIIALIGPLMINTVHDKDENTGVKAAAAPTVQVQQVAWIEENGD